MYMTLIINILSAILLFWYPIKVYKSDSERATRHPLNREKLIAINKDLDFLVYSLLTAMIFLGPLSLWKYAYWLTALLILALSRLKIKWDSMVLFYSLFIVWGIISELLITDTKFSGFMMLVKYSLPLLYLWLAYSAIRDSDDFLYFLKTVSVGMCVYALIIGGFSAKFLSPL